MKNKISVGIKQKTVYLHLKQLNLHVVFTYFTCKKPTFPSGCHPCRKWRVFFQLAEGPAGGARCGNVTDIGLPAWLRKSASFQPPSILLVVLRGGQALSSRKGCQSSDRLSPEVITPKARTSCRPFPLWGRVCVPFEGLCPVVCSHPKFRLWVKVDGIKLRGSGFGSPYFLFFRKTPAEM